MWKLNRPVLLPEWREAVSRFLAEYPPDTHIRTETERWELFKNEQQEAYKAIRTALEQNQQGLCAFCETALSDTNRQIEHFKNAELSPAEGRLPIFVTLRRLFFAEYR